MPLVSVLIPNYNHAKFLQQRIKSVLNQSFQNFELILLDDKSNDGSQEFLKKYQTHPKVTHIVLNENNSGSTFKQWKKGIELSKGKYIWIAESDDWAELDFLKNLVSFFDMDSNLGLVYSDSKIVMENGEFKEYSKDAKNIRFQTERWSKNYIVEGKEEIKNFLAYQMTINNMSAVLFKKEAIAKYLESAQDFKLCGDHYICLEILKNSKIGYCSQSLNNYRTYDASTTVRHLKTGQGFLENFKLTKSTLDFLKSESNTESYRKEVLGNLFYRFHFYQIPNKLLVQLAKIDLLMTFKLIASILKKYISMKKITTFNKYSN